MAKGIIEVVAPAGGLVTSLPDQALESRQWSKAEGIEFKTGIAARRTGRTNFHPDTGYPTPLVPAIFKSATFVTGEVSPATPGATTTYTLNADAGSGPLEGSNQLMEDHILIAATGNRELLTASPSIIWNTELDGTGTNVTTTFTNIGTATCAADLASTVRSDSALWYITRPPRYINTWTINWAYKMGVTLLWIRNVNTDNPIGVSASAPFGLNYVNNANLAAPAAIADITGITFSQDNVLVIGTTIAQGIPTASVASSLTSGAGQTTYTSPALGPLVVDSEEAQYVYCDAKGTFSAADGLSPGESFTWTPSAGTMVFAAIAVVLSPAQGTNSIIGNTSTEEVLNIFDFVVDDTTRHLIVVTNEHVWRYDPDDDIFIPIDTTNGVLNYTTGTVTLTDYTVTGAGGADWTAGGIAEDDIIHLTAGADQRYRRVYSKDSATTLTTEASWLDVAGTAGANYAIKRPLQNYLLANRPWALGYLGKLYIGSLDTVMVEWDGTALTMSASTAASGTLPKSADAIIYANHLMMGYTNVGASDEPRTIRWSSIGEPLEWNKPYASGGDSGSMGIDESQAPFIGFARLDEYCVVFMGDSIHFLSYVGGQFTFIRRQIARDIGALSREGIIQLRDRVLFVGNDNFYSLTTAGLEIIGNEVYNEFFDNLDTDKAYMINAVVDADRSEWIVSYKTASSPTNYPDRRLIYNYRNNTWSSDQANETTASAAVQVKSSASGELLSSITTPANEYPRPYDDVIDLQTSKAVLFGAGGSNGESDKIQQIAKTTQYTSILERSGLRLNTSEGKATENAQYIRKLYLGFNAASNGAIRVAVGSRFNENEDYTIDYQTVYTIGTNQGYLPVLARGKEFLIQLRTDASTGDTDFGLERYRLEGEIGGER